MKQYLENMIGFFAGIGGLLFNIAFLQTGIWWFDMLKAGATALTCGFLGVAGKHLFNVVIDKIRRKKKNGTPP